jgi:two-component system cell cycle sensor histidine kinase/response regulator CckA
VLTASSVDEALDVVRRRAGPPDLLVTDVVMPGLSGRELADRLRNEHPALQALFISGYTGEVLAQPGVVETREALLSKPFRPADFVSKVREMLDARNAAS